MKFVDAFLLELALSNVGGKQLSVAGLSLLRQLCSGANTGPLVVRRWGRK